MIRLKLRLGESKLLKIRFWDLEMKKQKKDVWKHIEKKRRERLKGVYIRAKRKQMNSFERR